MESPKSPAFHGGAFFDAIGVDFRSLERNRDVISADVLDAWYDPSPLVIETLRDHLPFLLRTSPPTHAEGLAETIALTRGVPVESVLTGGGSSSLIFTCLPVLLRRGSRVMLLDPTYGEYEHVLRVLICSEPEFFPLSEESGFAVDGEVFAESVRTNAPDAVLLVNPNSPTGVHWPKVEFLRWLDALPSTALVWVDETYIEYAGAGESLEVEAARRPNLVVVKSMSKVYALSGMRVAYLVAAPATVARLAAYMPPWPVGLAAQVAGVMALRDPDYYAARYRETHVIRDRAVTALRELGVPVLSAGANFYLARFDEPARIAASLRVNQIFVREFTSGPLAGRFLRFAVKGWSQTVRIIDGVGAALRQG